MAVWYLCYVYAGAKQGEVELRGVGVKIFADNLGFLPSARRTGGSGALRRSDG
ncbi:hypothetical protein A2U01_0117510 [Trifolium medium]|uniref:Uncharacterized protein n=1 Tax=Trifolium medium TaxID=97028 RepID=A0A392WBU0_9FABA|nr:hypothetical protein [Trifolium medium]